MNCVSLVFTVHEEIGLANAAELYAILERIRPDVVFLEVPPAAVDDFYKTFKRHNLESNAVRRYQESHQLELVPVDLPTPEREFFENAECMRMRIREASAEYRQLIAQDAAYARRYGFAYLNSEYSSKLCCDIYKEMVSTLQKLDDSKLTEIHASLSEMLELRENAMMKNINEYCRKNTFHMGVFLVGASHRQPFIDKLKEQSAQAATRTLWEFPKLYESGGSEK